MPRALCKYSTDTGSPIWHAEAYPAIITNIISFQASAPSQLLMVRRRPLSSPNRRGIWIIMLFFLAPSLPLPLLLCLVYAQIAPYFNDSFSPFLEEDVYKDISRVMARILFPLFKCFFINWTKFIFGSFSFQKFALGFHFANKAARFRKRSDNISSDLFWRKVNNMKIVYV